MPETDLMPHEEGNKQPNILAGSLGAGITDVPADPEAYEKAVAIFLQNSQKPAQSKD